MYGLFNMRWNALLCALQSVHRTAALLSCYPGPANKSVNNFVFVSSRLDLCLMAICSER